MEIFVDDTELYNSKVRLLNWLRDELRAQPDELKDIINEYGQKLPYNI